MSDYTERYSIIDKLTTRDTEDMSFEDLEQFFYSYQFDYYDNLFFTLSIEELREEVARLTDIKEL